MSIVSALGVTAVAAVIFGFAAAFVVKALHSLDDRISNPDLKKLVTDNEEELFALLRSHLAAIQATAAKFGVSGRLATEFISSLVDAEKKNPFGTTALLGTVEYTVGSSPASSPSPSSLNTIPPLGSFATPNTAPEPPSV